MDKSLRITLIALALLFTISLATQYYGSTDVQEYAGSSKSFAGKYNADIRTSHSILYGFIHSPLLKIFNSFLVMKIINLLFLLLIVASVYIISNKNKKTLLLITFSPIIWYMGPWINPIQFASLLFLWSFFFVDKFDKTGYRIYILYSGLLAGLAMAFWNTIIYISFILAVVFFYRKNVNSLFLFIISFLLGAMPLFILEQSIYGFFLYSTAKTFLSNILVVFSGGIYESSSPWETSFSSLISVLLMIPFFAYSLLSPNNFAKNKRSVIFIFLTILFFFLNLQVRYLLLIYPILILYLSKTLTPKQFRIQLVIFVILIFVVIIPYLIQIKYSTNFPEMRNTIANLGNLETNFPHENKLILEDLSEIIEEKPNETFIVGPGPDHYAVIAFIYWGNEVDEFVSIQDYDLYLKNESNIFQKRFESKSKINNRRQIWIAGGLDKNPNDKTDYDSIKYMISFNENTELENFKLIKKLKVLYLYEKT